MQTDLELIQAFRGGEPAAVDELVRRHLNRVRNLLFQLVLDNHEADDLTQDVFARVLKSLKSFRGEARFDTWLHRIVLNVAYEHLKKAGRLESIELSAGAMVSPIKTPEASMAACERKDQITMALGRLPADLRTAIVLTTMQGMSAVEAAAVEDCPTGTMYWRIHEARRRLRDELKDLME